MFPTPPRLAGRRAARSARHGSIVAALLAALVAALTAAAVTPSPAAAAGCDQAATPGDSQISMTIGGRDRTALVHIPPAAAGQPLPLLVALHSGGGLADWFESYTGLSQVADGAGFIVVYPNGDGYKHFWSINDHDPGGPDDIAFIGALLDNLESSYCVDPGRIYAFGVSNGGGMAVRLGCDLASRFAAIVSVAGGYRSLPPCQPAAPVSVLEVHGTSDGSVPYSGVPPYHAGAVRLFLDRWIGFDGCKGSPTRRRIGAQALRFDWTHCADGSSIEHIEIIGGGHQLPGALPPDKGPRSTLSVPWLAWSFLRSHRRRGPSAFTGTVPAASSPPAAK